MDKESIKSTRQKILEESLKLFSVKGYDGVSMREIAAAVGIKGASIYNHFKGKEDIFHAIFEEMINRYDSTAMMLSIPAEATDVYVNMDEQMMMKLTEGLFSFFVKDDFVVRFRKLLVSEQNKNQLAARTLKEYYFDAPIRFQTECFKKMQEMGAFVKYDAEVMALHFYSPSFFLLCKYDLDGDYEACMDGLRKHVHWFTEMYQ